MFRTTSRYLTALACTGAVAISGCAAGNSAAPAAPVKAADTSLSTAVDPEYDGPEAANFTQLAEPQPKPGTSFKVGFLNVNGGQPVLLALQKAAQQKVRQLGGELIVKDAAVDPQKQVSQLNELIAAKVDAIIAIPVVAGALAPSVAAATRAGIPFIEVTSPADQTKAGVPGAAVGIVQGFDYTVYRTMKALSEKHPGATFATMGLAIPVDALTYMLQRMRYWGEHFGLKFLGRVDTQNDTPSGYGPAASTILTRYPGVQVIVTYNDQAAVAVAATVATSGKQVFVATSNSGQSIGRDALKAKRLDLVYRTPWEGMGTQAAIAAYDLVTGQNAPLPKIVNVPSYLVTAGEADSAAWIG